MRTSESDGMKKAGLYSIGEVSRICNVSKKALRFYDKIGIISPDFVSEKTGYRYYREETLLYVPVVKYFKQMGFKLEEMKAFLDADNYGVHEEGFRKKIEELRKLREEIYIAHTSVVDWHTLILEAQGVIENRATAVSIKFIDRLTVPYLEFNFHDNYMESIINIEWTNYLESVGKEITSAVYIIYPNVEEKLQHKETKAMIFQKVLGDIDDIPESSIITVGGKMMISAYHIGEHENIGNTYEKMYKWAAEHGYKVGKQSIERYVTDYWTVKNSDGFVTEVLLDIEK